MTAGGPDREPDRPSSLKGNIGAQGLGQAANFVIQIALVPVLAGFWGLETYGVWLVLFTLPFYLLVGDLGLGAVAANEMTAAVAQGRRSDAAATFQAVQGGILCLEAATVAAAWWLATGPLAHWLELAQDAADGQAVTAVLLIVGYGLAMQQLAFAQAGMRAVGGYATGINVATAVTVLETLALLTAVAVGATIVHAAAIYFTGHVLGAVWLRWLLHRRAPWLNTLSLPSSLRGLRRLARPALAILMLPICYALAMQSPVLVLGAVAGAAIVPAFATVRTLSRAALQISNIVSTAAMPHFTVAVARGEHERRSELFALTVMTSVVLLLPFAIGLAIFGRWFVTVWTGGLIEPSWALVATLAVAMLLNGTWVPISNLILASNQQEKFSYTFLATSIAAIGLCAILAGPMGALGAGLSAVFLDGVMTAWIAFVAYRLGFVDRAGLREAPRTVWEILRRNLAARGMLGKPRP